MNRWLPIVFALVLSVPALAAAQPARDPAKLKLASANVLVLYAEGDNPI